MKANILIIEDEKDMAELVSMYLQKEGFETILSESAELGFEMLDHKEFDLIILDINLPGIDGFEFLQDLRRDKFIPVIIVSARESDEDIIMGLGIGADEFVVKPFSPKVLVAKVRALLRRVKNMDKGGQGEIYNFAGFTLEIETYLLKKQEKKIPLSIKEFEILKFLIQNAGRSFTPEVIYEKVWGNNYGDVTTVAVYIQRLRKKIEKNPAMPEFIETIHGRGYSFNPDLLVKGK